MIRNKNFEFQSQISFLSKIGYLVVVHILTQLILFSTTMVETRMSWLSAMHNFSRAFLLMAIWRAQRLAVCIRYSLTDSKIGTQYA